MSNSRKAPGAKRAKSGATAPEGSGKRPWRTPRLAVYGNLRHLALGTGGSKSDGMGDPKSRA